MAYCVRWNTWNFTVVQNHQRKQPFFFDRKPIQSHEGRGIFNFFLETDIILLMKPVMKAFGNIKTI